MSIVISGVNNNDKITASDGTIDLLSGVTYGSEITVPSLKLGSNIQLGNAGIITATTFAGNISGTTGTFGDFVNIGSNIQLGNAGVVTATTFVGNVTGNVNNTGALLLQIGGGEKVRITSAGKVGINETSPDRDLHISNTTPYIRVESTSANQPATLELYHTRANGSDKWPVSVATDDAALTFNVAAAANGTPAEKVRITSDGKLLIGHNAAQSVGGGNSLLQIQATNSTGRISVVQHRNEAGGSPFISLGKSRGTSNGSTTILQSGDEIGTLTWAGADGNDLDNQACCITGVVDGTPGSNDMPGRLEFRTTADGSASATTRMKISKEGYVTKPNLPTFCARWQSPDAQDLNSGDIIIFTHVASATSRWNNGGHYSTSTGKFTAPVAGFYYFAGRVMTTGWNNGDDIQDLISLQSSAGLITYPTQRRSRFRSDADANGYYTTSISAQVQAGAGATFWLQSNRNGNGSGWDSASAQYSFFTGWLIG